MATKIHIVSFDVPYPADYGGAIDVFYKVKSLHEAGAEVYLHCFQYNRPESSELNKYCKEVWYYPRQTGASGISLTLPYIVYSRRNETLLKRLQDIDAPILFEGVHCTYYLSHPSLKNRLKIVRNQNLEFDYYSQLAKKEKSLLKKLFFLTEASRLKRHEHKLQAADIFMTVSVADHEFFKAAYPSAQHAFIPSFHLYNEVSTKPGRGSYCLYHGNLGHPENQEAALFLLKYVVHKVQTSVIIAGRNPTQEIAELCKSQSNCTLVANPEAAKMEELIADAHIHLLPTFQPTGLKLKLLYALYAGRHVVVNEDMVHGTTLKDCCVIANNAAEMRAAVNRLQDVPFTEEDMASRKAILDKDYNNRTKAQRLLTLLQR